MTCYREQADRPLSRHQFRRSCRGRLRVALLFCQEELSSYESQPVNPIHPALAGALAAEPNVPRALESWEPARLALGNDLLRRVSEMGARSQFTNTWDPADPSLHFGLYGPDR